MLRQGLLQAKQGNVTKSETERKKFEFNAFIILNEELVGGFGWLET